jgi:hypothetical protein
MTTVDHPAALRGDDVSRENIMRQAKNLKQEPEKREA